VDDLIQEFLVESNENLDRLHSELVKLESDPRSAELLASIFRSVARTFGPHALAVVMTGMGSDGAIGSKAIRQAGGEILVQDQASSVVWGMPGAVAAAGLADQILPLSAIAQEIARRVASRRVLAARVPSPRP